MKKNLLLLLTIIFISFTVHAQITKGSVFMGGSLTYDHSSTDIKPALFISPAIGKVISENTVAGLLFNYNSGTPYSNYSFDTYGGGFFARRYKPLGKNFYLFGQGQLIYKLLKQISSVDINNIQTTKQSMYTLGFFPGISYGISRKFYVEATLSNLVVLSYSKINTEYALINGTTNKSSQSNFMFSTYSYSNMPLSLGFHFLL